MLVNDGDFCLLWLVIQLDIVSETQFSCDIVDRGLWLAILSSLLCPETDRDIRIGKQGYVSFLTLISVSTVVLTLGKVNFLNELISETFCLLGLLNSR